MDEQERDAGQAGGTGHVWQPMQERAQGHLFGDRDAQSDALPDHEALAMTRSAATRPVRIIRSRRCLPAPSRAHPIRSAGDVRWVGLPWTVMVL
jgi:hypothetical protein